MANSIDNLTADVGDETNEAEARWMLHALAAAAEAETRGEVPIGACLVINDELIATAGNRTRSDNDPTAHAEILVLRAGGAKIGNYRLTDATVYSTIEPCAMCAGALVHARVKRLVYGAPDERFGAVRTLFQLCDHSSLNHQIAITTGVLSTECRRVIQAFFQKKRKSKDEGLKDKG